MELRGLVSAVHTPFDAKGRVDEEMFGAHMEYLAREGVRNILVSGTTGEFFSLTDEERIRLLEIARERFPGLVLFHAGADALARTRDLARRAEDAGADGVAALTPYYYADLCIDGLVDYFNAVAAGLGVPFLIYNFPKHTQNAMTVEALKRIEHFGIKDSSADLSLIAGTERYYVGADARAVEACRAGALGFVSALASALPGPYVALEQAIESGDAGAADRAHEEVLGLLEGISGAQAIPRMKAVLSEELAGYPKRVRAPLLEV